MKVRIKENSLIARLASWKLHSNTMAITIGRTIYLHSTSKTDFLNNRKWVCHELAHVKQFAQYGFVTFLFKYTWESIRKGYRDNRWEVEARAAEHDLSLLSHFTIL